MIALAEAAAAIRRGELVVLPTDTVYGVAADPFSPAAVDRLLTAKGRGREKPSGVLVGSWEDLVWVAEFGPREQALARAFWPGGLSIVAPRALELDWDLGETGGTVMVRMPADPLALELLRIAGPLAVTSANLSGEPAALTVADARAQLGERVAVYLDGGPSAAGTASTIVRFDGGDLVVLREGAVSARHVAAAVRDFTT